MEFTVNRTDLVRELSLSQGVVEKKTTIPILSNVLLEAVGDRLTLTATDLELGIRCSCPARVKKEGAGTVPARKLLDYVRLLPESDYVSLHLHLNAETHHILDARRLALLRSSACLINVARGPLVDQAALYCNLVDGRLAGAGLDVFETEPVDPNDPLFKLQNVLATPHVSGATDGTSRRRGQCAAENIDRIAQGLEPLYRIDV